MAKKFKPLKVKFKNQEEVNSFLNILSDFTKENTNSFAFGGSVSDPYSDYKSLQQKLKNELPNRIPDPNEALIQNEKLKIKAKQDSENWLTQGLDILGSLAVNQGLNMLSGNLNLKNLKVKDSIFDKLDVQNILNSLDNTDPLEDINYNPTMVAAFGGNVGENVLNNLSVSDTKNINMEGGEMIELPDGNVLQSEGPNHEQGGMDVKLPVGSDIYSKNIFKNGISLADSKKNREKKLEGMKRKNNNGITDQLLNNAIKRYSKVSELEDQTDLMLQNMIKDIFGEEYQDTAALGLQGDPPLRGNKLYSNLTMDIFDDTFNNILNTLGINLNLDDTESVKNFQRSIGMSGDGSTGIDGKFGTNTWNAYQNYLNNLNTSDTLNTTPSVENKIPTIPVIDNYEDSSIRTPNEENNFLKGLMNSLGNPTIFDALGIYSQLDTYNKTKDLINENRIGDFPNVNRFENVGDSAIKTLESGRNISNENIAELLRQLELVKRTSSSANRANSMGINTMRALDIASEMAINDQMNKAFAEKNNQDIQLLQQMANIQAQSDSIKAQGASAMDEANIQDRDNYFSMLQALESTNPIGVLAGIGNRMLERGSSEKMINSLSNLLNIDSKTGKVTLKPGIDIMSGVDMNKLQRDFINNKGYSKYGINEKELQFLDSNDIYILSTNPDIDSPAVFTIKNKIENGKKLQN